MDYESGIEENELFQILETELKLREKKFKPFWNSKCSIRSKKWWIPKTSDTTFYNTNQLNCFPKENNWFDIKTTCNNHKNKESLQKLYIEPLKINKKENLLKNKKIRVYPNKNQKKILEEWFGSFRWFYNRTNDYIKEKIKKYNFMSVRDSMKKDDLLKNPEWCKDTPQRIALGAISDCCKAYKTCFGQKKNGVITNFNISYKTKKDKSQCLYLEQQNFSKKNGSLFTKISSFGKLKGIYNKKVKLKDLKIDHDCRLVKKEDKYYLFLPTDYKENKEPLPIGTIGLDSGIRTFQTGYSPDGLVVEIGKDCSKTLSPLLEKTDILRSVASTSNKRKKDKLFSRIKRINLKIKNKVDDLHWKTIKFLTSNYDTIVVSDFKTSSLLKNKKLNKRSKRLLCLLEHFSFKNRLSYKCEQNGNRVFFVDESYTSKTCSNCGWLNHNLGANKTFECEKCKVVIDRDVNAAKNILLKNWDIYSSA